MNPISEAPKAARKLSLTIAQYLSTNFSPGDNKSAINFKIKKVYSEQAVQKIFYSLKGYKK